MIDATHLKAHRTAASLLKGGLPRGVGRNKGGLNSKLHAVSDGEGRPIMLLLSALPNAKELLGDTEHRAVPGAREDARL
jgi:hypothetical protein